MTDDTHHAVRCIAKFRARCHNCGERIEAGERQWFAPGPKLVSHDGADPYDCGPPIDAPRATKPAPFKRETSADFDWRLGKDAAPEVEQTALGWREV